MANRNDVAGTILLLAVGGRDASPSDHSLQIEVRQLLQSADLLGRAVEALCGDELNARVHTRGPGGEPLQLVVLESPRP